jgi:deazaflavin-dependent oxidoreductase (nitroreductase family)
MDDAIMPVGPGLGGETTARLARVRRAFSVVLTHHGRKTGRPYDVRVWFMADGSKVYLTTVNMDRQWARNLRARPEVSLRIKDCAFQGFASVVSPGDEMDRVVALMKGKYPIVIPYLWWKKQPAGAFRVDITQ